jgi:hypothetical protein
MSATRPESAAIARPHTATLPTVRPVSNLNVAPTGPGSMVPLLQQQRTVDVVTTPG